VGASGVGNLVDLDARLTSTLLLWLIYVSYLICAAFHGGQTPSCGGLGDFWFADVHCVFVDSLFPARSTRSQ